MEAEVDLGPFLRALARGWYWIVIGLAAVLVAARLWASAGPPMYEATSLVTVAEAAQLVQLDPRIRPVEASAPDSLLAFPELATSDSVLQRVAASLAGGATAHVSFANLKNMVSAENGTDRTLVRLTVRHADPAVAALIANTWGDHFVAEANAIYGRPSDEHAAFYQEQLAEAEQELEAADQALVAFAAVDQTQVLSNTLAAADALQQQYLSQRGQVDNLSQDVRALRQQLADEPAEGASLAPADQLTALGLQLRAFNIEAELPLQFQLEPGTNLIGGDAAALLASLDRILAGLESRRSELQDQIEALGPQMMALQGQLEGQRTKQLRLTLDRSIAEETYLAVSRKLDEVRITSQETSGGIRLASRAAVPTEPVASGGLIFLGLSVLGGLLFGVLLALLFGSRRPVERCLSAPEAGG
ncbi:MAG: GNVR domain-containing protein, partial [Candidatus Promineifilaceae bacterium]